MDNSADACAASPTGKLGLRIAAIFVILATSLLGTFFPIVSKRTNMRKVVPAFVFEVAKFFGSGVILATGFIHLLEPAAEALGPANLVSGGGCLDDGWGEYPYAFGICLASLFGVFVLQLVLFRLGTERLTKMGLTKEGQVGGTVAEVVTGPGPTADQLAQQAELLPHEEPVPAHVHSNNHNLITTHSTPSSTPTPSSPSPDSDLEKAQLSTSSSQSSFFHDAQEDKPPAAMILGVATLEAGVVLHSVIIGLTLASTADAEFATLFVVIVLHQMFEGLGLGTRLAFLRLPSEYGWVPWAGAGVYALCTPVGLAIGLGVREGLSMSGARASIVSGVLDATSAGILIYTALVELVAHEFIFSETYKTCSWGRLWFSVGCFALGCGVMALLGKWA